MFRSVPATKKCNISRRFTAGGDDIVRACRLGPDGVAQTIDFSKRDAAAGGGSEFTGLQLEGGGKISAITCNPGVRGCMALTTPSRLRIFDLEAAREFSSKDFEAQGGIHGMCWTPTGATCLAALKNKTIVTHDPRAPAAAACTFPGHAAVAPNRLAYLKGNHFCSTGKGAGAGLARRVTARAASSTITPETPTPSLLVLAAPLKHFTGGTRELLWFDVRNASAAAGSYTVDTGSGTLLPLFDADTGMMVMPSKGDGSIRSVTLPRPLVCNLRVALASFLQP